MKTALITGASAGLGVEFARLFAANGHRLILVARRRKALEEVSFELKNRFSGAAVDIIDMDLGAPNAGKELYSRVKAHGLKVDFLVNNAGFGTAGEFAKGSLEKQMQMIDLNVRTLVELTHLFLPDMLHQMSGRILNVGSMAGFQPGPYMSTYFATKAFVNSFSEALNEELKGSGVSCTVLTPGATATEFAAVSGADKKRLFNSGHIARADEVAKLGFDAMMEGRSLAIPGLSNKIMLQALRISPRAAVRKVAGYLNNT